MSADAGAIGRANYATDKDVPVGSPLKLRASLDLSQVGEKEISIKAINLENIRKKEPKEKEPKDGTSKKKRRPKAPPSFKLYLKVKVGNVELEAPILQVQMDDQAKAAEAMAKYLGTKVGKNMLVKPGDEFDRKFMQLMIEMEMAKAGQVVELE